MRYDVADFSAKDSEEYNASINLFKDAADEADSDIYEFEDYRYYKDDIPTEFAEKTHNSDNFLDEDYLSKKKMHHDTSAIKELTEELAYGSTEDDLDNEITDGGVAEEIANVLKAHNITKSAVKKTLNKVDQFFGTSPDLMDENNDEVSENEEASDETDSTDETSEDETTEETSDSTESEEPVEECIEESRKVLKAKLVEMKKELAKRHLKALLSR